MVLVTCLVQQLEKIGQYWDDRLTNGRSLFIWNFKIQSGQMLNCPVLFYPSFLHWSHYLIISPFMSVNEGPINKAQVLLAFTIAGHVLSVQIVNMFGFQVPTVFPTYLIFKWNIDKSQGLKRLKNYFFTEHYSYRFTTSC